jgi:hypothetical protein
MLVMLVAQQDFEPGLAVEVMRGLVVATHRHLGQGLQHWLFVLERCCYCFKPGLAAGMVRGLVVATLRHLEQGLRRRPVTGYSEVAPQ